MQISAKTKMYILIACTVIVAAVYLVIGIDFEIFQYQFTSRLRKLILMVLVGGAIAASVVIFQAITTNRLLTPSIMGLDAIYMFVKVLIVFVFGVQSVFVTDIYLSFLISLIVMIGFSLLLFQGIFRIGDVSVYFILLVGIILGTFFRSITGFLELIINPEDFLAVQSAMFANFDASNSKLVILCGIILIILIIITVYAIPYLDVLLLGRDQAINLGISYKTLTRLLLILVSVLVSISTALVGPITFLGLLTVNLAHELMKTYQHKYILPATICISWLSLILAQAVVENFFEATTQVSIIIDLVGGSYFIYLLIKRRHAH
ncbi:iron chelate uptake ABC transporter family permease subunit [Staphylococcus pseudoxylosus]|uniref:iron chelate uptake ABC transporter family permease subunit n=1 Tax=Staphylococcus pseudoxylosus TaxID=2282419 RepID=UPI000D1D2CE9|nr:iron chelate uptake ABC transporter family permease subunit [Staphylococcus pseudoxylosus]PTI41093.1 iron ABC transporter permease [Staphylococcus xylosus]MDW8799415.1 iron chelate uptake ABC transporter family permease subunit [Staphylococcus pseudoxylosus]MEB6037160.1 iron chelate uptake ABC transporter family permease subunit [Staphylococcus pseudoxylosus]MEB6045769.1 iron chelate uptake ABC transporter family permease subunit [Staphylococcus pseudoxylosus]MEB6061601.1 iron chelate uptak